MSSTTEQRLLNFWTISVCWRRTKMQVLMPVLWPLTRPYLNDLCDALLHDSHSTVRKTAADILGQVGVNEPSVIEALHTGLIDSSTRSRFLDSNVSEAAARALTSILARSDLPE